MAKKNDSAGFRDNYVEKLDACEVCKPDIIQNYVGPVAIYELWNLLPNPVDLIPDAASRIRRASSWRD